MDKKKTIFQSKFIPTQHTCSYSYDRLMNVHTIIKFITATKKHVLGPRTRILSLLSFDKFVSSFAVTDECHYVTSNIPNHILLVHRENIIYLWEMHLMPCLHNVPMRWDVHVHCPMSIVITTNAFAHIFSIFHRILILIASSKWRISQLSFCAFRAFVSNQSCLVDNN